MCMIIKLLFRPFYTICVSSNVICSRTSQAVSRPHAVPFEKSISPHTCCIRESVKCQIRSCVLRCPCLMLCVYFLCAWVKRKFHRYISFKSQNHTFYMLCTLFKTFSNVITCSCTVFVWYDALFHADMGKRKQIRAEHYDQNNIVSWYYPRWFCVKITIRSIV